MALGGNTVRLTAEFKTFEDVYADPTSITLKIYTRYHEQVGSTISIISTHKISTGIYKYDYTIPLGYNELSYEFSGTLEGSVVLGRSEIDVTWT